MKILLAEDDPSISTVTSLALQKLGHHEVFVVTNGLQAVEQATANQYDLILLDSMMPGLDGISVCRKLKQEQNICAPIIFLSAKSQDYDIVQGMECGAIGYIVKPFDPRTICQRIDEILDSQWSQAA